MIQSGLIEIPNGSKRTDGNSERFKADWWTFWTVQSGLMEIPNGSKRTDGNSERFKADWWKFRTVQSGLMDLLNGSKRTDGPSERFKADWWKFRTVQSGLMDLLNGIAQQIPFPQPFISSIVISIAECAWIGGISGVLSISPSPVEKYRNSLLIEGPLPVSVCFYSYLHARKDRSQRYKVDFVPKSGHTEIVHRTNWTIFVCVWGARLYVVDFRSGAMFRRKALLTDYP